MLPTVLIVLGTILTIFGVIGLISLSIQPFFKAIRVVFFHSTDDLVYDSGQGKITLEKEYKILKRAFMFFLITGAVCLGSGWWLKYAPRGNDSLQSEFVDGAAVGNDENNEQQGQEIHASENYTDADGKRYSYCISVSEKTIFFNGQEIGGTEEFEAYLKTLNRGHAVLLKDDFAAAPAFHKVEELLNAYGMNYEIE